MDAQMIFYDYGEGFHFNLGDSGGGISTSFQCSTDTTLFYL